LHAARFFRGPFLHAASAFASFCARVNDLGATLGLNPCDTTLPAPANVALEGEPKIAGCGDGAALHESPVEHGGGVTDRFAHGAWFVHSRASYMSKLPPKSCEVNWLAVRKKTSPPPSPPFASMPPVALASMNADCEVEAPEEIRLTQPPDRSLKVAKWLLQPPTAGGSYSYTSHVPLISCGARASPLLKNKRPLSDR
jgi:hypothetical protein